MSSHFLKRINKPNIYYEEVYIHFLERTFLNHIRLPQNLILLVFHSLIIGLSTFTIGIMGFSSE